MFTDEIKLFCQKQKRIGNSNTSSENMQSGRRDRIRHRKTRHANIEKRQMTPNRRNGTTKSKKKERSDKKKRPNTSEYWKQTPSNKR